MVLDTEKEAGSENSPERIREVLNSMQVATVPLNGENVYIKTKNHPLGNKIFKELKLKLPKNINTKEDLDDCFKIKKKETWGQSSLF